MPANHCPASSTSIISRVLLLSPKTPLLLEVHRAGDSLALSPTHASPWLRALDSPTPGPLCSVSASAQWTPSGVPLDLPLPSNFPSAEKLRLPSLLREPLHLADPQSPEIQFCENQMPPVSSGFSPAVEVPPPSPPLPSPHHRRELRFPVPRRRPHTPRSTWSSGLHPPSPPGGGTWGLCTMGLALGGYSTTRLPASRTSTSHPSRSVDSPHMAFSVKA